ncbi:Outer membrane protein assembly factor BamB, contains PQQ-like beta-propeller repeat [Pseudonocardia thermophila]|uniref:Outer membrane protein assembly factor BamB, contains PQQ-like beta-propeller repeat n=1 Tax=Pseudonocardia thermophila TaxID=1848 RepID=A0A1M6Q7M5_PSETH|nr:PQQ-binding-like beta-propeller repeat protein [Pseudonocardia thermophila]SHK16150.1 Outer membrane protein assembly factor BamB, contains PQQ-like beta-propeller repeat [Pseudonocardia thermophila]
MRSRVPLVVLAVLVLAGGIVAAVATRGGCTLDDVPPVPATGETRPPDLAALGAAPPAHATPVGDVDALAATPDADVLLAGAVLSARHPRTGALLWSVAVPGETATIAVSGNRVVGATTTDRLRIFGLDAATGTDRWCRERGASAWPTSPLVTVGDRAVLARQGALTAVDATTGAVAWEVPATATRLLPAGGRIVADTGASYAVSDGAQLAPPVPDAEAVAADTDLTLLRRAGQLVAIDRAGTTRWTAPSRGTGDHSATILADGVVLDAVRTEIGDRSGFRGLDAATGGQLWRTDDDVLGGRSFRAFVPAGGHPLVVARSAVGRYDPHTGEARIATADGTVAALATDPTGRVALVLDGVLVSYPRAPR